MAIRGGQILHLGGSATVIDRLQSVGADVNIGSDTIREVGNYLNVDKVKQDPEVTFTMESFDVSTEAEALLSGRLDESNADADGTEYLFSEMGALNIISPWKDEAAGSAGTIDGGVVLPGYFTTRASYRFGVDDNAGVTFELSGSDQYLARFVPQNERFTASATASGAYTTTASAVLHRVGGYDSGEQKYVLGVVVNGQVQIDGSDFTVTPSAGGGAEIATVTFADPPADGASIEVAYFASAVAAAFPQTIHPDTVVKPGAVRGRDIKAYLHLPASGYEASGRVRLPGIQSVTVDAQKTTTLEREMGTLLPIGRTVESVDVTGDMGVHPAGQTAFFKLMRQITGVDAAEVVGILNDFPVGLEIEILNPKDRSQTLKTLFVEDAKFQVPGTPARAGAVVDFTITWESAEGELAIYKAAKP
jgi:hypothetical protein